MKNRRLLSLLLAVVTVLSLLPLGIVGATAAAEAGTLPPTLPGDPNTIYKWGHYAHPTTGKIQFYFDKSLGVLGRENGPSADTWGKGYDLTTFDEPGTLAVDGSYTKDFGLMEAKAPANPVGIMLKVKNNSSVANGMGFTMTFSINGLPNTYTMFGRAVEAGSSKMSSGLIYYYDYGTYDSAFQTPMWRVEPIASHNARIRQSYDGYIYIPLEGFYVSGKPEISLKGNADLLTNSGISSLTISTTDWDTGATLTVESVSYVTLGDRITSAAPILSDGVDLAVRANVRGGAESASLVFTFEDGGENGAPEVITLTKENPAQGDNVFYLVDELKAQNLTRTFDMQLYIDGVLCDTVEDYCIRDYAMRMLNATGTSNVLACLLVDLLAYGAEAQKYVSYKTEDLATSQMTEYQKGLISAAPDANDVPYSKYLQGDASLCEWTGASLVLNSRFALRLSFRAPDLDLSKVEVRANGEAFAPVRTETADVYSVLIEDVITAKTFTDALEIALVDKATGNAIGETLIYAASDYVRSSLSNPNADPAVKAMAGAAYNYAWSAFAYADQFVLDNNYDIVLPSTANLSNTDVAQLEGSVARFKEAVAMKTGVQLGTGNNSKKITVRLDASNTYTGYEFLLVDGEIEICLRDTARLDDAFEMLVKKLGTNAKLENYSNTTVGAPAWFYEGTVSDHVYSAANESYQMYVTNTTEAAFNSYCADLINRYGYTLYTENRMGESGKESIFATYRNDKFTVYVTWNPVDKFVRVTESPAYHFVPDGSKEDYVAITDSTLLQHARYDVTEQQPGNAVGLGLIYQLSDGRFMIIDGGPNYSKKDVELTYNYLMEHKPATHEKPVIAAWFFTHEHGDHTWLAMDFINKYYNQIEIEMFVSNYPDFTEMFGYFDGHPDGTDSSGNPKYHSYKTETTGYTRGTMGAIEQYYPEAKIWIMHAGQKHWIGNAEVEIILTHEDVYQGMYVENTANAPGSFGTQNEGTDHNISDNVFRITVNGTSAMILGDSHGQRSIYTSGSSIGLPTSGKIWWGNDLMPKWYGSYLECDILQTAHHGINDGLQLYQAVNPTTVIWPTPDSWTSSGNRNYLSNKWLYDGVTYLGKTTRATKHYFSNYDTLITLEKCPGKIELPMMPMQ